MTTTRLLEDSIMPAESSMRRGRACSSVMVTFQFWKQNAFFCGLLLGQRKIVWNWVNIGAQCVASGKNKQKDNECASLRADFHKVIPLWSRYVKLFIVFAKELLWAITSIICFPAGKRVRGQMLAAFHWGRGCLRLLRREMLNKTDQPFLAPLHHPLKGFPFQSHRAPCAPLHFSWWSSPPSQGTSSSSKEY